MRLNSDLIIKSSLSGNEENYAPSVKAVKTKTDSIDSNISTINGKITTINNTLPNRLVRVVTGNVFGSIPKGSSKSYSKSDLGLGSEPNSGLWLVAVVAGNPAWRGLFTLGIYQGNISSVKVLEQSYFEFSRASGSNWLTVKNTHDTYSVNPQVWIYRLVTG